MGKQRLPSQRPEPPLMESPGRWPCWHVEPGVNPEAVARSARIAWQTTGVPQRVAQTGEPDVVYGCPHPAAWQNMAGCHACSAPRATVLASTRGRG